MGLFDFLKKSGKSKFDKRYVTYERVAYDPPGQHMRILRESMDICMKTVNPDTFFSREKLAVEEASYCREEPDIVWNGMNCEQIYRMLRDLDKREAWHREFIDRLFERGKEDNLTFHMFDAVMTDATADYFVKKLNGKKYHFCRVGFPESNRLYTYVTKDLSIKPGDSVTIPTGNGYVPDSKLKQVVEVFDASLDELDFPVVKLRCIEEKLKSIVCPHCGASIEINVGEKVGRCTRCQSEFYLIDYNQNTETTNKVSTVIMPEIREEPAVPEKSTESKPVMQAETKVEEKEAPKEAVQSEAYRETAKSLDQEEKNEPEMTEEVTEPETSEEAYESDIPGKPDNDPGTYSWDDFYPFHDNDDVVDMMREEGVKLVQGSGIKPGDLAMALGEVEKEKNRLKILSDLKSDGYHIQERDIVDYFDMEGDGKVLNEMISLFTGTFSKKAFMEFYTCGTEVKLSTMLKKAATNLDFTENEIIDILNSIDDSDLAGIKELLARYNPRSISKNTVIEICDVLPSSAIELARKYLKLLPFADRVEIQDDYF